MPLNTRIAVIGTSIAPVVTREDASLEELIYEVTQDALRDAGLTANEIDGIVVASNDQFDGRAISIMMASAPVGGVDRDILSTPSAAEHAFVMGALRVATGQYRTQLVVAWSPNEASSLQEAERLGNDPYFHRRLPLDELSSFALQASALGAAVPAAHSVARSLSTGGNSPHAGRNEDASVRPRWPLEPSMISKPVTGLVAIVLASDAFVQEHSCTPAWLLGMGWATEAGFLGDRNLSEAPALVEAARQAYSEAGIDAPTDEIDVAELTDPTPYQYLIALDALGIVPRDRWEQDLQDGNGSAGRLSLNPSGGVAGANAVFCNGLIRIAEAANQVRGCAGEHQRDNVKTSLAHGASGFAMMYQTVVIMGHQSQGAAR